MDQPRALCPQGPRCPHIRTGSCSYWHQNCPYGIDCKLIKKLDCPYYHPRALYHHYRTSQPSHNSHSHSPHNTYNNYHRTRPENDRKRWSSTQDSELWQWMNNNNPMYHKCNSSLAHLAKKFKRTNHAIEVRMELLNKLHYEKQQKSKQKSLHAHNKHKKTMRKHNHKSVSNYNNNFHSKHNNNNNHKKK
eukprot:504223_1